MKNSDDTIGNRTRDHPACSAVSQPTTSPHAPTFKFTLPQIFLYFVCHFSSIKLRFIILETHSLVLLITLLIEA